MFDYRSVLTYLRKNFGILDVLIAVVLIGLFLVLRIVNLGGFPIFSDEGIYINWAKIAANDANWRFISLTDGKQPLQTWMTIPFLKFFPYDALFAGRLVGVTNGLLGLIGMFVLLFTLFGKRVAHIGAFLFVVCPMFLFYDRMALIDSGVNAWFIWILFFSIVLVRTLRLDVALLFGLTAGIALLAKSSVSMFIALSALAPILRWRGTLVPKKIDFKKQVVPFFHQSVSFYVLFGIATVLAFAIYNLQRLSPFFHYIAEKNTTFVLTPAELLADPFQVVWRNIPNIPYFIGAEMGYVIPLLGIIGLHGLFKNDRNLFFYLLSWIVLPFVAVAFAMDVLFPRYIIFFAPLMLIPAAYFLGTAKNIRVMVGGLVAVVLSVAYLNYTIMFDAARIPFPQIDRGQYIEDWPAGWGAKETMEYARKLSATKPVIILAEGNFGMSGDVLNSLIQPGDEIKIEGRWPLSVEEVNTFRAMNKTHHVLAVFPHKKEFTPEWPLELVEEYKKPGGKSSFFLFKVKPE
jgi:4-amino-4-deoxy-L-arabinose transferase-like glycosyltransferase